MPNKIETILNRVSLRVGQEIAPQYFPETCSIKTHTPTKSATGGKIKGADSDFKTGVPCVVEKLSNAGSRFAGKDISTASHKLKIPCVDSAGERINFDITVHRKILVNARGLEPAKTYLPIAFTDKSGVVFEIICEKEN